MTHTRLAAAMLPAALAFGAGSALVLTPLACAQDDGLFPSLELSQRAEASKSLLAPARDYILSTTRLRLGARWRDRDFDAEAAYDASLRLGDYFQTADAAIAPALAPRSPRRFGTSIWDSSDGRLEHRFYRLNVGFANGPWEARLGRQRTLWSEGLAFSAIDAIHVRQPLDPEPDLEPADSIYARAGPAAVEVAPFGRMNDVRALARAGLEDDGFSVQAYLGRPREERSVRTLDPDHPRVLAGAGVRVPVDGGRALVEYAHVNSNLTPDFDRALVSVAWGRRGHEWLGFEYFFNGQGTRPSGYGPNRLRTVQGDWAVLGRHYLVAQLGNPETVKLLWNADDGSWMLELALRRAFGAWSISAGTQLFEGEPGAEFASLRHRAWAGAGLRFGHPGF